MSSQIERAILEDGKSLSNWVVFTCIQGMQSVFVFAKLGISVSYVEVNTHNNHVKT